MVPVLLIILMINFSVPRLRATSFADDMQSGQQGELSTDKRLASAEHYLARWRNTGRALPALVNLRVWYDDEELTNYLRETSLAVDNDLSRADKNRQEKGFMARW